MSHSTFNDYVAIMGELLVIPNPQTDPNFQAMLETMIDSAENSIYRDLDLLDTVVRDSSANLTANSRNFTLPTLPASVGTFNVLNGINVITPSGATVSNGTRNQLTPVGRDYLDAVWPSEIAPENNTVPQHFAMITSQQFIVGPPPGAPFNVEVVGTIRPAALSPTNPTTILSINMWDLLIAASMIFGSGWQKNFGAAADDPRSSSSWSAQYQNLLKSATTEEFRKKFAASAWSSLTPSPIAQPPRQ